MTKYLALVLACGSAYADSAPQDPPDATTAADPQTPPKPKQTAAAIDPISSSDSVTQVSAQAPGTTKGLDVGDVRFELHGYARMSLAVQTTPRAPYLVDNDPYLSGFSYTRLYEPDWSELFFSARRGNYKAEFGLFASLYSDYSSARLENQLGIAQASVTAEKFLDQDGLSVQVGVFWDRFGYLEPYDTYVFGRTHQGGAKVAYALPGGGRVQAGIGVHQAELDQNLGLTPIAHVAAAYPFGPVEVGTYVLRTWTRDKRQLSPIQDGTMYVAGADARYRLPDERGTAYLAFAYYNMDQVLYLAPALEVMHSLGGRGITENFLGLDASNNGSGHMYTLAGDTKIKLTDQADIRGFGMITWVRSPQVDEMNALDNRDRRLYLKWGIEPGYKILPKLKASVRFDRVILDVYDSQDSFRVLSPKLSFPLDDWGELFFQYSHYLYGDKIQLRPGQVPLETMPDSDVFKLQANVRW